MSKYASKLLEVALAQVGYLEKASNSNLDSMTGNPGYNNYTKFARDLDKLGWFYNGPKNGYAWCDVFVDWCFVTAFGAEEALKLLQQPKKSCGAGCYYSANYYKTKGQFHTSNPKPGDQIFFWNSAKNDVAHTGLVYEVDANYVYTVEGNTSGSSGVVANGGGVFKKKYSRSYARIYGYGRPNYDQENTSTTPSEPATPPKAPEAPSSNTMHKVVKGDCLWNLAERWLGNGNRYKEIMTLNNLTSTTLRIGQMLKIPSSEKTESLTIKVGDTVRVKTGAKTYTGGGLWSEVYKRNHKVKQIDGDRVVITYTGIVVAAVKLSDLILVQ